MDGADSTTGGQGIVASDGHPQPPKQVLIVEPEQLTRWSIETYLGRWCDVFCADSLAAADRILDDRRIDAVVVSDDLSDRAAEDIESHARSLNPSARVVRTVTARSDVSTQHTNTPRLEKPFELARLATLLGVTQASPDGNAKTGGPR